MSDTDSIDKEYWEDKLKTEQSSDVMAQKLCKFYKENNA